MNKIITIGREFGSGGREIGRRLSDALGFAYYDQEVIVEIAKRTKLSEQYVQQIMEHRPVTPFPIHFGCSFYHVPSPAWDQNMAIYKEQRDIILLRYYFRCPYSEIAKAMEIDENAARTRVHRIRQKLKTVLGDDAYERISF